MKQYYTYILTNKSDTLYYTGVTNDLVRRLYEHREKINQSYTSKYNLSILVYYEIHNNIEEAIKREKQIKSWNREKKKLLVYGFNPMNKDLWDEIVK